jgi:hypothetical protein
VNAPNRWRVEMQTSGGARWIQVGVRQFSLEGAERLLDWARGMYTGALDFRITEAYVPPAVKPVWTPVKK